MYKFFIRESCAFSHHRGDLFRPWNLAKPAPAILCEYLAMERHARKRCEVPCLNSLCLAKSFRLVRDGAATFATENALHDIAAGGFGLVGLYRAPDDNLVLEDEDVCAECAATGLLAVLAVACDLLASIGGVKEDGGVTTQAVPRYRLDEIGGHRAHKAQALDIVL